jgi:phosphopantetheinyl transferase (holo-ACP synthase)
MATTSLPLVFESFLALAGCGIDCEKTSRIESIIGTDDHPFPFVFTRPEIDHCRRLANPARGLNAAFCCKEALYKALCRPYNFTECEVFFDEESFAVTVRTSEAFRNENGFLELTAAITQNPLDNDELIASVYLLGKA